MIIQVVIGSSEIVGEVDGTEMTISKSAMASVLLTAHTLVMCAIRLLLPHIHCLVPAAKMAGIALIDFIGNKVL